MATALLEVTDLACRRGGRKVFEHLSFGLAAGELLALVGRNGSGKTTLLRALALLVRPDQGSIRWQGAYVGAEPEAWRGRLAWLGHLEGLKGDLSVAENLLAAERLRGAPPAEDRLDSALVAFDLPALSSRAVRTLSAGQRRRTALARVVLAQAPLWLLDEPLNALDAPAQAAFRAVLERHLAAGGLAIAATHADLGVPCRTLELGSTAYSPPPSSGEVAEGLRGSAASHDPLRPFGAPPPQEGGGGERKT
ncbi:MAG: heme ABC exporter ATP-binding protein CcmA [Rhodospirillales bacterium]|nr:heme ABC exporter ATP-binding protein CcmA [Rhodospirillales bacterium]